MFNPLSKEGGFEWLAKALSEALEGNYNEAQQLSSNETDHLNPTMPEAPFSVFCGDADFADPDGPYHAGERQGISYWRGLSDTFKNQSAMLGPILATNDLVCAGWRIRPKWRFTGPFTTPPADPTLRHGSPAAPILITSSKLDPVTPLHSAYLLSNYHPGSAVLVHEIAGHCAIAGSSECFSHAIRTYFDNGIVPVNGSTCNTTCKPFSEAARNCSPLGSHHTDSRPQCFFPTLGR